MRRRTEIAQGCCTCARRMNAELRTFSFGHYTCGSSPDGHAMKITEIPSEGFERVVHALDPDSGLDAFIAVHSTVLGPACGGLRMLPYQGSEQSALADAKRLAFAMTYKSAVANTGLGGGKAVILGDPATMKTEKLLRAMGRFVDSLGGIYITAEDMNITTADLEIVRKETRWVAGLSRQSGSSGNPSPFTALGCFLGMRACAKEVYNADSLAGLTIALQGVGAVGNRLALLCIEDGAQLAISDIDAARANRFGEQHGCTVIPDQEMWLQYPCDILSPCARGEVLNADSISKLQCKIVAGSANNQLCDASDADRLYERGILYAPDYVLNAGGIINVACEFLPGGYNEETALKRINHIDDALVEIIAIAKRQHISTNAAARHLAEARLAGAQTNRVRKAGGHVAKASGQAH